MDLDGRSSRCSNLLDDLEPVAPPIPATPALTSRSRPPEPVHATGEWPSDTSRKHVRGSSSEQGTGSAGAAMGRPREVAPRPCYLCLTPEDADDPIQLPQKDQAGDGVPAGTRLKIKWAYPRVKGMAQGNYCWYCQRTAQAAFPGLALKELSDRVADPRSAERKHFHTCRTRLLEVLAEKGSWSAVASNTAAMVVVEETSGSRSKHRGRLVSVRKFKKKETGDMPDNSHIVAKRTRAGKLKDMVKVFAHSDSSSWSFEDSDVEAVTKQQTVDDGALIIDDAQMSKQFESTRKLALGLRGAPGCCKFG